jgi:hypothetical protein
MATEAEFDQPVVTEHTVAVRSQVNGDCFVFRRIGQSLSPALPDIDHDPLKYVQAADRSPRWELGWLARKLAERALSNLQRRW